MSSILDGVDRRTQLAGHNRLELLLFRLGGKQVYGINVFKVQEVIQCPALTHVPHASRIVRGIANMRGKTIPVLDTSQAIGRKALAEDESRFVVITEYNRTVQGFLVNSVDRIINMRWDEVLPPPKGTGRTSYLTAVTNVDGAMVEIIDVEKILAEISHPKSEIDPSQARAAEKTALPRRVLVADDSSVARKQVARTLEQLGIESVLVNDGLQAIEALRAAAATGKPVGEQFAMVISDIEMPEMDGYTLTAELRKDPKLKDLYVLLHTSLSGVFNQALVERVGANRFVAKFDAVELANAVLARMNGTV